MRERNANDLSVKMYIYGITQQDVADELGITRQSVGMILNGRRGRKDPTAALAKVADAVEAIISRRRAS